jgi:hypothetical protein
MRFKNEKGELTATLDANPGGSGGPFLSLWIAGPLGVGIFLHVTQDTAQDLRLLADEVDAVTYAVSAGPAEVYPDDLKADARTDRPIFDQEV